MRAKDTEVPWPLAFSSEGLFSDFELIGLTARKDNSERGRSRAIGMIRNEGIAHDPDKLHDYLGV